MDGDTGFGNPLNTIRTVRLFRARRRRRHTARGSSLPKRCGHFAGKAIISIDEMVQKIKAAVDTRRDGDLQIIVSPMQGRSAGLSEAIDAPTISVDAGADVTFVEAPENLRRADPDH